MKNYFILLCTIAVASCGDEPDCNFKSRSCTFKVTIVDTRDDKEKREIIGCVCQNRWVNHGPRDSCGGEQWKCFATNTTDSGTCFGYGIEEIKPYVEKSILVTGYHKPTETCLKGKDIVDEVIVAD